MTFGETLCDVSVVRPSAPNRALPRNNGKGF
jgi:hypothetical protein